MHSPAFPLRPVAVALSFWALGSAASAQNQAAATLETVTVEASADASAEGLSKPFAGGQVARGGRVGLLGTQDLMDTPFQVTSYTHELILDQQAKSVADVLQSDPAIRATRGYGNFQETYILRGLPMYSDDVAYNGLYGMLPRQYVASEFFERVEVLHGANAFLNGAAPGGSNLGGAINLLPKRASNEPLSRVELGVQSGGQASASVDLSRRFGPDQSTGVRLNAVRRDGETAVEGESRALTALGLGLDWRSRDVRLSAHVGYQNDKLKAPRPSVKPNGFIPVVPDGSTNYAQPWTYSHEKDVFATVRAEWDLNDQVTAWAAGGVRRSQEANSLAAPTVNNRAGDATIGMRFDNAREDDVSTGEVGLRGHFTTGSVKHNVVASTTWFSNDRRGAWGFGAFGTMHTNIYHPVASARPDIPITGDWNNPGRTEDTTTRSYALADTLAFYEDRVRLTLGLRHQSIEQNAYAVGTGVQTSSYKKSATTPVAGVVFKATEQVSLYANYIEGLVRGESIPLVDNGLPVFNGGGVSAPYKTKQKEVGVKWDGKDVGATLALYTTDKPNGYVKDQVFAEYGKQRYRGVEANVFGEPVKGLRVLGGVAFTQAKVRSAQEATEQGKNVAGVPRRQLTLGGDWDVPGTRGLALNARVVYTASQFVDKANTLRLSSWARTDFGARYLVDVGNNRLLTLRARIDNLFDRKYWASVDGGNSLVQAMPRTFTLSASVDF